MLPAVVEVVVTTKVDLSRVDTGLVTHISSFLVTPRELLNLALTCKAFGWRRPTSTLNCSLVEEVARQAVSSRATDAEMSILPRYASGTTTWLSILHRYEHLLDFDVLLGGYIEYLNGDKTTVCAKDGFNGVAVSSGYVMRSGAHYAEFQINGTPYIGVVRPMPGLDAGAYDDEFNFFDHRFRLDFLAQRSDDWGNGSVHACLYCPRYGSTGCTDWDDEGDDEGWEGRLRERCTSGDTVGMLLDLDDGTLTVYKNNRRLGVIKDGLSGPYCWYVNVDGNDTVAIIKANLPTAAQVDV